MWIKLIQTPKSFRESVRKYLDGGILYPPNQDRFDNQLESIRKILSDNSLLYIKGGVISGSLTTPTKV